MALLADLCYGHPSGRLKVVGFTGTKGKSTSAYYLKSVLDAWQAGQRRGETGVISSIDTYDGVERFESHLTTPEPLDLQRHLAHAADAGLEYLHHGGIQPGPEVTTAPCVPTSPPPASSTSATTTSPQWSTRILRTILPPS